MDESISRCRTLTGQSCGRAAVGSRQRSCGKLRPDSRTLGLGDLCAGTFLVTRVLRSDKSAANTRRPSSACFAHELAHVAGNVAAVLSVFSWSALLQAIVARCWTPEMIFSTSFSFSVHFVDDEPACVSVTSSVKSQMRSPGRHTPFAPRLQILPNKIAHCSDSGLDVGCC